MTDGHAEAVQLVVYVGLAIVMVVGMLQCNARFTSECERRGGHVKSVYKGRLCLSRDGRVIEWD